MLRIGHIKYANCTPIFNAMHEMFPSGDYEYVSGVPAHLNAMLSSGEIDICPSSSIAFSMSPDKLMILPDLSISSFGPVQSVLLFSTLPIEELNGRNVLLSAESATSVNLLKILLKKRYGCDCSFEVTSQSGLECLDYAPALLLIGDAALRAAQSESGIHIYDLGELWYDWTGTPFVFALWLVSRSAYEKQSEQLRLLARQFCLAKKHAMANLECIVDKAAELAWMGRERLLEYWKVLSYDLTDSHVNGLQLFFKYAAELGLIASAPELVFLPMNDNDQS